MSKTKQVGDFIACGNYKKALAIAKTFRIGVTANQRSEMALAYECILYPDFYSQIGTNIKEAIEKGVETLLKVAL